MEIVESLENFNRSLIFVLCLIVFSFVYVGFHLWRLGRAIDKATKIFSKCIQEEKELGMELSGVLETIKSGGSIFGKVK